MNTINDDQEYKLYLNKNAQEKNHTLIPNATNKQAELLIQTLLKYAKNTVCIFTGSLNEQIYATPNTLTEIKKFLSIPTNQLNILIQNKIKLNPNNPLIQLSEKTQYNQQCTVKYVTNKIDAQINSYFITANDNAYRLQPIREYPAAVACFNNQNTYEQLNSKFIQMFESAKKI